MDIIDSAEQWRWDETIDDGEFCHTMVVATGRDGKVYFTKSPNRQARVFLDHTTQWTVIPENHIHPPLPPDMNVFEEATPGTMYHKVPRFVTYDESDFLAESLLKEAKVYESLQHHDSPFLARYHGCLVSNGRITGLALSKYSQTLGARIQLGFEKGEACKWFGQTCQGTEVLHKNGMAHNDLNPTNIMISDGNAVIIDFDSCCPIGEALLKCGTPGWSDDDATESAISNDTYGLHKLAAILRVLIPPEPMCLGVGEAHSCLTVCSFYSHNLMI